LLFIKMKELHSLVVPFVIYFVIPLIGLVSYINLRKRIVKRELSNPPTADMFWIFFTYGGLLTVILTSLFWKWSGMASLGFLYLILLAPVVMAIISYRQYKNRKTSIFHQWMLYLGVLYFVIAPLSFFLLFYFSKDY